MSELLNQVYEIHVESSDSCNLNCKYCYFLAKKKQKTPFSIKRFAKLIDFAFRQVAPSVNLVFHGGEPLMNSAEWLEDACTIAEDLAREQQKTVSFHLQTNGTLLTNKHIDVLQKHQFDVNVSLDGPEDIHNAARGSYKTSERSIKMLQEAGVFLGTITVIGKHNYNKTKQVVEDLLRLGVKRYHFNVGSIISRDPTLILTAAEILQYYKESLDVFLETYQDACNWVLLGKLRRYCTGVIPQFACDSPICGAGMHKIHLLPNGDYYPCGSCVNDESGLQKFKLGNIFHPMAFDEYKQTLLKFQSPYFSIRERCETCNATSICDFVCPAFDSMDTQTFENKCDSNQNFIHVLDSYGQQHFQPLLSYYSNCDE